MKYNLHLCALEGKGVMATQVLSSKSLRKPQNSTVDHHVLTRKRNTQKDRTRFYQKVAMHIVGYTVYTSPYPHCLPIKIVDFPLRVYPSLGQNCRSAIPMICPFSLMVNPPLLVQSSNSIPKIPYRGSKGSIDAASEAFNGSALAMGEVWWKKHGR